MAQDDASAHALAENRIRHWHAGYVLDRRMSQNEILDLFGTDFFATPIDQVFFTSFAHVVPGRMTPHQIARAIKAVGCERPGIVLRHAEVTAQCIGTPGQEFTDLTRSHLVIVIVY